MTDPQSRHPQSRQFEMEIEIAAPRQAVWQALTEVRELTRWFAPQAEVQPGEGGTVRWTWREHHDWPQTIEAWEPGRHLRTRYDSQVESEVGQPAAGRRPLFVDFHLEGDGGVTTLRLVHSGFGPEAAFDEEYDGIRAGWPVELRSLRHYLENHRGTDRQLAWATRSVAIPPEAAWRALTGPAGLQGVATAGAREGRPLAVAVPGTGRIEGRVLHAPTARELSGTAANLGNGWFRVHCERWGGATQVWLWLALYGQPRELVAKWQAAFEGVLARLEQESGRAAAGSP